MSHPGRLLPRSFYARDVVTVARALLGQHIRRGAVELRITEVEAYRWPGDTACHARSGRTARNAALWDPGGHAYVYLCYGLHNMLNIVAGAEGEAAAVLVRSCEVIAGHAVVARRRGTGPSATWLAGPGKVGQALALDPSWSHTPLFADAGLAVLAAAGAANVLVGPRVGIDYALPQHRALPWRFADAESVAVTRRGTLTQSRSSGRSRRGSLGARS